MAEEPKIEKVLSNAYYTRFHIWQTLVRYSKIKGEEIPQLASEGWEFIWGDDVLEEREVQAKDDGIDLPVGLTGGSYL